MRFGLNLGTIDRLPIVEGYVRLAEAAERFKFDSIWHYDHIVMPRTFDPAPYRRLYGRNPNLKSEDPIFEPLTTLAFLAGKVSTPRLGISVMVVPYRNPVLTAKMLSNLDVLSGGRLIVGVGAGWNREEFDILGAPPYEDRGRATDEYLDVFIELWTSDTPSYEGKHCRISNANLQPKPVQQPHPPIWVGGHTIPALRRVARYGQGWLAIGGLGPQDIAEKLPVLRRVCESEGRDPDTVEVSGTAPIRFLSGAEASGSDRRPFSGTPQQIVDDIRRCQEMGIAELRISVGAAGVEAVERFAEEVRPRV